MDITILQGPTSAFVNKLPRLPPEIVHQVLDNLTLFKVLHLLAQKSPYIKQCVLTHKHLGKLFQSALDITSVIDYFILLFDMRQFTNRWLKGRLALFLTTPYPFPENTIGPFPAGNYRYRRKMLLRSLPFFPISRNVPIFPRSTSLINC
jgi:hypothetical protein